MIDGTIDCNQPVGAAIRQITAAGRLFLYSLKCQTRRLLSNSNQIDYNHHTTTNQTYRGLTNIEGLASVPFSVMIEASVGGAGWKNEQVDKT